MTPPIYATSRIDKLVLQEFSLDLSDSGDKAGGVLRLQIVPLNWTRPESLVRYGFGQLSISENSLESCVSF